MPRIEPFGIFDLYNCPNSILEDWHEKYKRGKLWPEAEVLRVRFRYHTFRLNRNLAADLRVLAFHEHGVMWFLTHLLAGHPKTPKRRRRRG